jgi:hypothetical protein
VKRWIERWNAYWFPQSSTLYLAIARIIVVAAQLFWVFPSLEKHLNLLRKNTDFIDPQLFIRAITAVFPRETFFTPSVFAALYWVTAAAGLAALLGLFTRTSMFAFALGIWIFIAHEYSYGDRHHTEAIYCIFLLCLAFAPSGDRLSLDALRHRRRAGAPGPGTSEMARWPLTFAHVLLSMTYFSTGASKLISGGLGWMNGYTLQRYTFNDAINRGFPFGIWLGQQHTLAILLSIFTVLFELFFFLSLFLPRWAPLFFATAIMFHVNLYMAAGHDFFQHIVLNFTLLICISPGWWEARLGNYVDPTRADQAAPARRAA